MSDHPALQARYRRLREVGLAVNHTLVSRLAKDTVDEGAAKLGILKKGVIVFDSQDEMAVLMDYCLHDIRRQGRNTIDAFLAEAPFPSDSDEMVFLKALQGAFYSLFLVESVEPGLGIHVRDLLRGGNRLIVDMDSAVRPRQDLSWRPGLPHRKIFP